MGWQEEHELSRLFAANRQRRENALSAEEKRELAVARDLETFAHLRDEVIKPELDRLAKFTIENGWHAKVLSDSYKPVGYPGADVPRITIYFAEDEVDAYRPDEFAYARFSCTPGHFQISFAESDILPGRGGSSGTGRAYKMNDVTPEWVNSCVTKLLMRLLQK